MSSARITAVISFCSNDWRFLKRCIEGVSPFCQQVIVTVCDHFFDGTEENYALLEEAFLQCPHCTFLEFCFDPSQSYRPFSPLFPEHPNWRHEWHNTGRWLGYLYSSCDAEYLLFLDCDEIIDSKRFPQWLDHADLKQHSAYRFASFWHFRQAQFVATTQDDCSLLVEKEKLLSEFFWDEHERCGLIQHLSGEKKLGVQGCDGMPMIRHFSGVRTKEEFRKKLASWGHHWERDWEGLLNEEFSRPFNGNDFIRRYHYQIEDADFDPLAETVPALAPISFDAHIRGLHRFENVVMVSRQEAFRRDLQNDLAIPNRNGH